MRSGADISCIWCATSRSPLTTLVSVKPDHGWVPLTEGTDRRCWHARLVSSAPRKSGSSVAQYDAAQALDWGLVNTVVPLAQLEKETIALVPSDPHAVTVGASHAKAGFNAAEDGLAASSS